MPLSARQRQTMLWLTVALTLGLLLVALGHVLAPFVAAAILAYVLEPAVRWLHAHRVPRALATVVTMLAAILVTLAIVLILVPIIEQEVRVMRARLPELAASITGTLLPWLRENAGLDLPVDAASLRAWFSERLAGHQGDWAGALFSYARSGWGAALQIAGMVFLVPVVLFFLLLDWEQMVGLVHSLIPPRWREPTMALANEVDTLLGRYLRGQGKVMLVLAAYYSIGLLLAGFKLWLPIGVLTGLLVAIPYLGFALGLTFALIDGMLQLGVLHGLAAVAIVYGAGQMIEGFWLTPRLVGVSIGLHPLAVIFALLAFGSLFGFVGVLLALPLAAIFAVGLRHLRSAYRDSEFFQRDE
jgi:predicted PurR-regulated permease PerM